MAGVSTDTVGLRVKPGSFVVKRGSSILNEKLLDKILGKKPKGYAGGGTVPIKATPKERIAPPEVVDMYGIDFFRAINNSSDNAAHSSMDALIAQSELAGMKPMYDGGEVAPGYQEGGLAGLQYAEDYEYSPTSIQKLLDKLPGLGGKRAYDRAREYEQAVHWNPEDVAFREAQARKSSDVMGSASQYLREDDDITTANLWQQRNLVSNTEDPRSFGYSNISEDMDKTFMNQYIYGSPSGHIMETDDTVDYAVDPSNIVKSEAGRSLFGIPLGGYSGSVRQNPGIDPYIDPEYFKGQIEEVDAQRMQEGDVVGYQQGEQVVDPNDPLNIDARMQMGAQAYPGGINPAWGGVQASPNNTIESQREQLLEGMKQDEENKALKALELLRLQGMLGDAESVDYPDNWGRGMYSQSPNQARDKQQLENLRMMLGMQ
jgi:hypothetical protein